MYIGPLGMENFQNKSRHILLCPRTKSKQILELGVLSIIPTAQICNNAIFYEICKQKKIYDLLSTFLTFTLKKKHRAVEILLQMKPDSFLQLRQKKLLVYIYAVTGSASLSLSFLRKATSSEIKKGNVWDHDHRQHRFGLDKKLALEGQGNFYYIDDEHQSETAGFHMLFQLIRIQTKQQKTFII